MVTDPRHGPSPGVVLHDGGHELDVWIGEGMIARVPQAHVADSLEPTPPARMRELAQEVLRFAGLREGQAISILGPGPTFEGVLRERCRYGALVERADDTRHPRPVMAIGFRRLAPR